MFSQWFATKKVEHLQQFAKGDQGLKRTLSAVDLVLLGIGCTVGTGIFVLTGHAAAINAGPAVILSFLLAGIASVFAGLCYAEMASIIPVSGSAYTYAYATMGEIVAWMIGWDLMLEYLVGSATVAVGWSGYVRAFTHSFLNLHIPEQWARAPFVWDMAQHQLIWSGWGMNIPAVVITCFSTILLILGIETSARFNAVMVGVKIVVIFLFIGLGVWYVNPLHWQPFVPPNTGEFGRFGWSGVFQGATMVFFAYVGFDAVSTTAQEAKNPQRDLPIGILGSLAVCSILYIAVASVLTGLVPYTALSVPHPIAKGVQVMQIPWLEFVIEIGAIAGLSSVMLGLLMAQPRIFYSMAHDGLLPRAATKIHPKFQTPYLTTALAGGVCALMAGLLPVDILGELTSIGTLFAFFVVGLGVLILRIRRPDIPRLFMVPGGKWFIPGMCMITSGFLMASSTPATLIRLLVWMLIGLIVYAVYGSKHSVLRRHLLVGQQKRK